MELGPGMRGILDMSSLNMGATKDIAEHQGGYSVYNGIKFGDVGLAVKPVYR